MSLYKILFVKKISVELHGLYIKLLLRNKFSSIVERYVYHFCLSCKPLLLHQTLADVRIAFRQKDGQACFNECATYAGLSLKDSASETRAKKLL